MRSGDPGFTNVDRVRVLLVFREMRRGYRVSVQPGLLSHLQGMQPNRVMLVVARLVNEGILSRAVGANPYTVYMTEEGQDLAAREIRATCDKSETLRAVLRRLGHDVPEPVGDGAGDAAPGAHAADVTADRPVRRRYGPKGDSL
jgi:hypothetical protein